MIINQRNFKVLNMLLSGKIKVIKFSLSLPIPGI